MSDILGIAAAAGITLRKAGRQWRGVCPFHQGTNPQAFSVDAEEGLYHCFSCGAGGSAKDLAERLAIAWQAPESSSFPPAAKPSSSRKPRPRPEPPYLPGETRAFDQAEREQFLSWPPELAHLYVSSLDARREMHGF